MTWLASRSFALTCAVQRLARRPWATLTTLVLAALAIALLLALGTLALALQPAWTRLGAPTQAVVFLKIGATTADITQLTSTALSQPGVTGASHVPRDAALAGLARIAPGAALPEIKVNPLPDAIVVRFAARASPEETRAAIASLSQATRVDAVQFDAQRHRRWHASIALALAIAGGLGLVTLLITSGLVLVAHRALAPLDPDEREVLHLAGADPGFANLPAALAGALLGGASALLAIALVAGGMTALAPVTEELRSAWGSDVAWSLPALSTLATLAAVGVVIGWLGGRCSHR